jgi:hypothetical protein
MVEEFGTTIYNDTKSINTFDYNFEPEMELIVKNIPNRVLTISNCNDSRYLVKEARYGWTDDMIIGTEGDYNKTIQIERISSRFEILDL